jgi:hypothetical protein
MKRWEGAQKGGKERKEGLGKGVGWGVGKEWRQSRET